MRVEISNYIIETDSLQFIIKEKGIVQEGRLTKAENVGKEKETTLGYYTKFEDVLKAIPQEVLKGNDDMNIIKDKLIEIKAVIEAIDITPQVESSEDITISKAEYESLLTSDRKLEFLENYGVDNWGGYSDAMKAYCEEYEESEIEEDE